MMMNNYHVSVLLRESVDALNIDSNKNYADVTYGGGGHTKKILEHLKKGKLISFDQDKDAIENKIKSENLILVKANFKYLSKYTEIYNLNPLSGILADLGVSSHQIDTPSRGFSIRFNSDLDMRMDVDLKLTAKDIINEYEESKLRKILKVYGELKSSHRIAKLICDARERNTIKEINQLKEILMLQALNHKKNKFFAKVFQALRIEVNQEIEVLKQMLVQSLELLEKGGRLVVISYHSIEDRIVKNFFKTGNFEGVVKKDFYGNKIVPMQLLHSKVIVPSKLEIENNPRARSAKMRIAFKK